MQKPPSLISGDDFATKCREIEKEKAEFVTAENQWGTKPFFAALVICWVAAFVLVSCVKKPDRNIEDRSAIRAELAQLDSTLSQPHVQNYAKAKTIIRMAAGESAGQSNYKAIGQVVRKFVDIIKNPSIGKLMENPLVWFDALLEWEVAYKSINRMNEDDYLTLLESSGEADYFWSTTSVKWTSSWEHLLLALAWEQGENKDFAIYEAMRMMPEEFGNNEFSVMACWLAFIKLSDWGYPEYAKTYLTEAKDIIEQSSFRYTGKTKVSWLGTTRDQAREDLLYYNELIGLIGAMYNASSDSELYKRAEKVKEKMASRPQSGLSEIYIVADFMLSQILPEHKPLPEAGKFFMMEKMNREQGSRKIHKLMFGAYLATWLWETFLDKQIIAGMENMPIQTFKLLNTLGAVKENVLK